MQTQMNDTVIVRHVSVNRNRTPEEALDATGRGQYTDPKVVNSMPRGEGDEVEVVFFKLDRYVSNDDLYKEYERQGLKPCDPYSLAAVNEADPAFVDLKPNATHWKDGDGRWCLAKFGRWGNGLRVDVSRSGDGWGDGWWFAGLRIRK